MREILFRGKRDDGKWLYGSLVTGLFGEEGEQAHILDPDNGYYDCFDHFDSPDYEVIPETVGQFTGLLDKYGRKIFEGDIVVTCPSPLSISDGGDTSKRLIVKSWVFTDMCHSAMCRKGSKVEKFYKIVGNIYDNPDLMKES
jgi:uncharacterized phage protein (TIGR01671 family)